MTVLVTGFPALRARQIVAHVAEAEPDAEIVALVAQERREQAAEAVAKLGAEAARRVELVEGDATAIDFGLSGRDYRELARRVEVVHGAYSITDASVGEELALPVNVGATRELVELCRAARPPCGVVFYSSVFVSGNRSGVVREDELEARQAFRNPAEKSLAIAERMLRQSGVPAAVLRSGHLLGDSRSGEVEHLFGTYPLLVLIAGAPEHVVLPLPSGSDGHLPITPVDHLAAVGAYVGRRRHFDRTLHVLDPERTTLRRFLELAAEHSGKHLEPSFNPSALTRVLLGNPASRLLPQNARGILEVLATAAEYDMKGSEELLAEGAPRCPPLTAYLDILLAHVRDRIEHGTLSPARRHPASFLVT